MNKPVTWPWLILILLLVGTFYLSTIRQGHVWGDDFAMYIHHARNIVEGKAYADTGYIYNPLNVIGPETYPPVFPLLLAPVYRVWGLNLAAMKVEIILLFLLSLLVMYLAFVEELGRLKALAVVALTGFNPRFWAFKENIVSDLPFLLFVYLSFYFVHKFRQTSYSWKARWLYVVLISASVFLAYGTRSIGLVLIPCLVVYYVVQVRKPSLIGVGGGVVIAVLIYLQIKSSDVFSSYAGHFGVNAWNLSLAHGQELVRQLSEFWVNGYSNSFRFALFVVLAELAGIGYFARLRIGRVNCFDLFVPIYLIPLIFLPISLVLRFLFPLVPLYLFYVFLGMRSVSRFLAPNHPGVERVLFAGVIIAVLGSYIGHYSKLDFGPIQNSVTNPDAQQLYDYIQTATDEKDVIICDKPRAMALFANRMAGIWHYTRDDEELWQLFRRVNASYLIVGPGSLKSYDLEYIEGFVERNRGHLQETYSNADFIVYRIVKS